MCCGRHIINIMSKKILQDVGLKWQCFSMSSLIDTAEDVAVPLPVLNTEINVTCNPPLPIPLNVRTDCRNCAKRKDELQRMAKVNRMLKQQLKMNNHRSRHINNLKQALQRKAKLNSIFVLK